VTGIFPQFNTFDAITFNNMPWLKARGSQTNYWVMKNIWCIKQSLYSYVIHTWSSLSARIKYFTNHGLGKCFSEPTKKLLRSRAEPIENLQIMFLPGDCWQHCITERSIKRGTLQ